MYFNAGSWGLISDFRNIFLIILCTFLISSCETVKPKHIEVAETEYSEITIIEKKIEGSCGTVKRDLRVSWDSRSYWCSPSGVRGSFSYKYEPKFGLKEDINVNSEIITATNNASECKNDNLYKWEYSVSYTSPNISEIDDLWDKVKDNKWRGQNDSKFFIYLGVFNDISGARKRKSEIQEYTDLKLTINSRS